MNKSKNSILREEYKTIAKFLGYTYFERTKNGSTQNTNYPGWFDTNGVDLTKVNNSICILPYKHERFITSKTLGLNFKYDFNNLMKVVEFIEKLPSQRYGGFEIIIIEDTCTILPKRKTKNGNIGVKMVSELGKKDAIYGACLKFIEKYNKLKEKDETNQFVS